MSDDALWHLKARALLLPSPYAAIDPGGEEQRAGAIERWLTAAGAEVDERGRRLLASCARDAHDAHVPSDQILLGPARLLHPLSAQEITSRFGPPDVAAFLERLPKRAGLAAADWYRKLWRAVMTFERELPASLRLPDHTVSAHRNLTAALAGARWSGGRPALLFTHIGPVQGFIAAARRTHDLWIASFTLSFLAFSAVKAIAGKLGPDAIVYPDISRLPLAAKLLFREEPDREAMLQASLPNKLLAVVPEAEAEGLAAAAAEAAAGAWREMGRSTRVRLEGAAQGSIDDPTRDAWGRQMDDHLEIDASIQPWPAERAAVRNLLNSAGIAEPWWLKDEGGTGAAYGTLFDVAVEAGGVAPGGNSTGAAYGTLFDVARRVLASHRRALEPPAGKGDRRPKCTSCGLREQMGPITPEPHRQQRASREFFAELSRALQELESCDGESVRLSLQLVRGEGLCAVCLTKRFAPEVFYGAEGAGLGLTWKQLEERALLRFPSVASVASAPLRHLLRRATEEEATRVASAPLRHHLARDAERGEAVHRWLCELDGLHRSLNFDPPGNLLRGLGRIGDRSSLLAVDGAWLYDTAYEPAVAWRSHNSDEPRDENPQFEALKKPLKRAVRAFCAARDGLAASPYYAVLVLDGDRMGKWLTGQHEQTPKLKDVNPNAPPEVAGQPRPLYPALHGELSRRLARLAVALHDVVDRYLGRVVYSGGDDLLAFLPLGTAPPCLAEIHRVMREKEHLGDRFTFSAGLAIAHWRDPLQRTIALAREAEGDAKGGGRDSLAIAIDKRSGAPLRLVLPWEIKPASIETRHAWAPDLPGAPEFHLIDLLMDLIRQKPTSGEAPPLSGTKAAYRLEQEVATLGHIELRSALVHRIDVLLGLVGRKHRAVRERLRAVLASSDERAIHGPERAERTLTPAQVDERACANARMLVDLLLFARFLLREEHGIDTAGLLDTLPQGGVS
jgi:CRISPR-associated protein Cmr2